MAGDRAAVGDGLDLRHRPGAEGNGVRAPRPERAARGHGGGARRLAMDGEGTEGLAGASSTSTVAYRTASS